MDINAYHTKGLPVILWKQTQVMVRAENSKEWLAWFFGPGIAAYIAVSIVARELAPFWLLLFCLLFGAIPGSIMGLISVPIRMRIRYAKLEGDLSTLRTIQHKPVYADALETPSNIFITKTNNDFELYFRVPAAIRYAGFPGSFGTVDPDAVVDFTVQDGATWMNVQGIKFSVIVMRMRDGQTRIVALHYGNQADIFALQQAMMREFVTKRPRTGWAKREEVARQVARRRNDTI